MKMRWAWILPVLTIVLTLAGKAWAQGYPADPQMAGYGQPAGYAPLAYDPNMAMYAPQAAMMGQSAAYYQPDGTPTPAGQPPAGFAPGGAPMGPMAGPEGYPDGSPAFAEDFGADCPYCGGRGCDACGGHHGLLGDVLGWIGPYPDGGCCATRWYDLAVDFMLLKRDSVSRRVDFTSRGIAGPIVLSTANLDFDEAAGFRFSGMFQVGPGSSLEFTYFGLFFWESEAIATSNTNNLFSALSNFGTFPFNGFAETDNSDLQSIRYTSQFDNFEVNFRQRYVAPSCRYQGSWLIGVRYFKLDEGLQYQTRSSVNQNNGLPSTMNYEVDTFNSLTGVQLGGDLWFCIVPGLRVGGEAKFGVYGNHAGQLTQIDATSFANTFSEQAKSDDVAFVGEIDLMLTYRLSYNWNAKVGYQLLYVDGVALAPENFNATPPAIFFPSGGNRRAEINDNGHVFYHGFMAGLEYMW